MRISMNRNNININGKNCKGSSMSIVNGKVTIDGVVVNNDAGREINIIIEGDVDRIENECGTVTAKNVGSISTQSGDVECGDVSGSISSMSGDVRCGNIGGGVSTMSGDIKRS